MVKDIKKIKQTYENQYGSSQLYLYDYYNNDKDTVPVYQRKPVSQLKAASHTNIHINLFEDIIQRKIGYMASNIKIKVKDNNEDLIEQLNIFDASTNQHVNNIDSITLSSISGLSHRLVYTLNGEIKIKNIPGWQVVYNYDHDIFKPTEAYYFYSKTNILGKRVDYCNIYDEKYVSYYIYSNNVWIPNPDLKPQPHNFNQVPLIPFQNNKTWKGDCDSALQLMDVYDEIISDTSGELKAARLAYLKIWGDLYTGVDEDGNEISIPDYLREFGTMLFGKDEMGNNLGDAQFLEKKLDDTSIQNMLNRLRTHIFEVSGSVDLKELSDNNNQRVFSIQAALSRLENNAMITEQYAKAALRKQYELVFYFYKEMGIGNWTVDDIDILFKREFIKDTDGLVNILLKLMSVTTVEDAYAISGLFEDPESAAERYREENPGAPDINEV